MKANYFLFLTLVGSLNFAQTNVGITGNVNGVYINEFHYDNIGADVGEFIEVAGPAGTDLSTYILEPYNGGSGSGAPYNPITLSGSIDDEGSGVGAVLLTLTGSSLQNGSPDGFALSSSTTSDVQFISYEGSFTAVGGAANGLTSVDIGVSETNTTPIGWSLEYDETTTSWVENSDDSPGDYYNGTLSVSENQIKDISIFPNPAASGFVTIKSPDDTSIKIVVHDLLGKEVINEPLINNHLNVTHLKSGLYIVKIYQNNTSTTRKLVVK